MSVLDLFASALGAFILITVILFPYYNKAQQLKKVKTDIEAVKADIVVAVQKTAAGERESVEQQKTIQAGENARSENERCQERMRACLAQRGLTFLVVAAEWTDPYDVDLYVMDPSGRRYYFSDKKGSSGGSAPHASGGSNPELSLDMLIGPGIEVWQAPKAESGVYKVQLKLLGAPAGVKVPVKLWTVDRSGGRRERREVMLEASPNPLDAFTATVSTDGGVTLFPVEGS